MSLAENVRPRFGIASPTYFSVWAALASAAFGTFVGTYVLMVWIDISSARAAGEWTSLDPIEIPVNALMPAFRLTLSLMILVIPLALAMLFAFTWLFDRLDWKPNRLNAAAFGALAGLLGATILSMAIFGRDMILTAFASVGAASGGLAGLIYLAILRHLKKVP